MPCNVIVLTFNFRKLFFLCYLDGSILHVAELAAAVAVVVAEVLVAGADVPHVLGVKVVKFSVKSKCLIQRLLS